LLGAEGPKKEGREEGNIPEAAVKEKNLKYFVRSQRLKMGTGGKSVKMFVGGEKKVKKRGVYR